MGFEALNIGKICVSDPLKDSDVTERSWEEEVEVEDRIRKVKIELGDMIIPAAMHPTYNCLTSWQSPTRPCISDQFSSSTAMVG